VLWQGRPCWHTLARRAFQVRKLAAYFVLLLVWYLASALTSGEAARAASLATLRMTGVALVPLMLVYAYSWATSRSTIYTITDRRVVMSIGCGRTISRRPRQHRSDGGTNR
jgi:predicted Na+-dependent transporter